MYENKNIQLPNGVANNFFGFSGVGFYVFVILYYFSPQVWDIFLLLSTICKVLSGHLSIPLIKNEITPSVTV
mgnify:CR=1 FL=1